MNSSDSPQIALLTEASEEGLDALRRGLRRAKGFAFFLVVASDAARAEVLRRLRGWSGERGVPELHFFPEGEALGPAIDQLLARSRGGAPLSGAVIPDGEALLDAKGGRAIADLNFARDNLGTLISGPLVLILPARRAAELSTVAPDLYDVRSFSVEVESMPLARMVDLESFVPRESLMPHSGAKQRKAPALRVDAVRLRELTASPEGPPKGALVDAWLNLGSAFLAAEAPEEAAYAAAQAKQLAEEIRYDSGFARALVLEADILERGGFAEERERCLRRALALVRSIEHKQGEATILARLADTLCWLGQLTEAESLARRSAELFEELGNQTDRMNSLMLVTDTLTNRGYFDESQRILENLILPYFTRRGEDRRRAVALDRIARILDDQGQMDEAMRIRRQEELPVFKRLKDDLNYAIALRKVAETLGRRGQPDEAVRILKEEVLPIFERLGSIGERARAWGSIAKVLRSRGELDEAIHILADEVLPPLERLNSHLVKTRLSVDLARDYLDRGRPGDREEAQRLLHSALRSAESMGIPEIQTIRALLLEHGLALPEAAAS